MKEKIIKEIEPLISEYYFKKKIMDEKEKVYVSVGYPDFNEKETIAVLNAMLELNISQGQFVKKFESMFSNYIGVKFATAVNSGTSANFIAIAAFIQNNDLKPGDEVIVPAATFPTVVSPILQHGLLPVFVDVKLESYNIDPKEIQKAVSKKTKLLMPVHSLGNPCEMKEITEIAEKHGLKILEDCCEAHGAKIGSKFVGSFGDLATISFFVAHNITTGEGGMVFSNSEKYDEILRSLREFGRIKQSTKRFDYNDSHLGVYDKRYVFTRLGYNLRMTDIAASIGIEQLKKIEEITEKRLQNVIFYTKNLEEFSDYLVLPKISPGTRHTFYSYPITVKENSSFTRNQIAVFLEENGIETRPFFAGCLPDQPGFLNQPKRVVGDLKISKNIKNNTFFVGCHQKLEKRETGYVVEKISEFIEKNK